MALLVHDRSRSASGASSLALRGLSLFADAFHALRRWAETEIDRRRTLALLHLDDHMLRDIGVTRADVYGALVSEGGEHPTHRLARVRDEQRHNERAQASEARRA